MPVGKGEENAGIIIQNKSPETYVDIVKKHVTKMPKLPNQLRRNPTA